MGKRKEKKIKMHTITLSYTDGTSETIEAPMYKISPDAHHLIWSLFKACMVSSAKLVLYVSLVGIPLCRYLKKKSPWFAHPFITADCEAWMNSQECE